MELEWVLLQYIIYYASGKDDKIVFYIQFREKKNGA